MTATEAHKQGSERPFAGRILLTGVTGFLGSHLLYELLTKSDMTVSCLVRSSDDASGRKTLLKRMAWYFPEIDWHTYQDRVQLVLGDIGAPQLGLSKTTYDELAGSHDLVLNSAGVVSSAGAKASFLRINTESVATLLEFAQRGTKKQVHHVSTIDVKGQFPEGEGPASFSEKHLEEGQTLPGPYADSKYRAELLMRKAFAAGVSGSVYRVGYIAPHGTSGRFQQNIHQNHVSRYLRAAVRLGFAPATQRTVRPTPVDSVARAIVTLMTKGITRDHTYYVASPYEVSQYDMLRVLQAAGYPIRLLRLEDFLEKGPRVSSDEESLLSMSPAKQPAGTRAPPIDASASQRELARLGFAYPRPSSAWLGAFLRHAIEVGFLEAPRFWNLGPVLPDLL